MYREVNEETVQNIKSVHPIITVDFFVKSTDSSIVHHIAVLYTINITRYHTKVSAYVNNEINDSKGYVWIDTNKLNDTNASPIILELLYYQNFSTINSRSEYPHWQILE